jgi:hypothetical protein
MRLLSLALGFIALFDCLTCRADSFVYASPLNQRHNISIQTTPPLVASGDIGSHATFCDSGADFICVRSDLISFAVPKALKPGTLGWQFEGQTYRVLDAGQFEILGLNERVLHVETTKGEQKYLFVYSPRRGLLAFEGSAGDAKQVFLADRARGFAAQGSPLKSK